MYGEEHFEIIVVQGFDLLVEWNFDLLIQLVEKDRIRLDIVHHQKLLFSFDYYFFT